MVLCKNNAKTLEKVIYHQKQGLPFLLNNTFINPGEIILIQQTKSSLIGKYKDLKPIRWIMNCEKMEIDTSNESDKIWGSHWKYIIHGSKIRSVNGFDFDQIKSPYTTYSSGNPAFRLYPIDEEIVLKHIELRDPLYHENEDLAEEFNMVEQFGSKNIIDSYDKQYSGKPNFKEVITRAFNRPSELKKALIKSYGTKCEICKKDGFKKKDGSIYCELHHMIEINKLAPNTLQSWNTIIVCPNCHRQLHYGNVESIFLDPGWKIVIDGIEYIIKAKNNP